jgi:hypothetical protein
MFASLMIVKIIVPPLSPPAANEQAGRAAEGDDEGGDEAATSTWQNFLCYSLLATARLLHKKFYT